MDATTMLKQLQRLRTLGRGASGAVVGLASGELLAVKSAGAGGAEQLRREGRVLSGLCSPHIVPCLGSRAAAGGEYQLFLEFAAGGSLADEAVAAAVAAKHEWMSPKSTLHAAFWNSDDEDESEMSSQSAAERICSLARPCSALPDWDSEEGWIDVQSDRSEVTEAPTAMVMAGSDFGSWNEALDAEIDLRFVDVDGGSYLMRNVGAHDSIEYERYLSVNVGSDKPLCPVACHGSKTVNFSCHCNGKRAMKFDFAQISSLHDLLCACYLHFIFQPRDG